jgi:hypothetical protein
VEQMDSDQEELRSFVTKIEAALAPGFAEVLSEETRKTQRALLVLSFLLLLVVLEAINSPVTLSSLASGLPEQARTPPSCYSV